MTEDWRKIHEKLHYSSPNITSMIKSKKIRWAGHVTCMGRLEMFTKFWLKSLKGRDHSEELGVDGRIILMDLREIGRVWIGFMWLRTGTGGGLS
jgi:hypothetical protein